MVCRTIIHLSSRNGMLKIAVNSLIIILILTSRANAQDTLWTKTFGGMTPSAGHSVRQTSDNGYILGGFVLSANGSHTECLLVKTDSIGQGIWEKRFGGESNDFATEVYQVSDGGYIVGGYTSSFGAGNGDFYLIRTNSAGDELWSHTYGGSGSELATSMALTAEGGFILAGRTQGTYYPDTRYLVVKTDSLGNEEWHRTYGNGISVASSIIATDDAGYIIAGYKNANAYLVKIDANGTKMWDRIYGGAMAENAEGIVQTADG
ncbi:MAG: hypothetical protein ABIJ45_15415, partial [Candidatus Zixiibacteriota bacterium]